MIHNKIFLIGFMGSGKTTLAKKLAKKLNYNCFDLDFEIEKNVGVSIPQVFEEKGEEYFRSLEHETLRNVINNNERFVLSVGGGTPCFYNNMDVINENGTSIYLKYNAGILTSRLINAKAKRPLIKNLGEVELKAFVEAKLSEREKFYKKSKLVIASNNIKIEDLLELL